ncbi:TPA: hypothetical protein OOF51_000675 [Proteus mirabilis]|nr:hypothetical protein [Proteus mirabilis]HEJ9543883.1 hypothetical protein [Proteus mirabilis]
MKEYQDTETGQIYEFEDDFDPFTEDNRNLPKTLSVIVKSKPDDTHVWYQCDWIKQEDAPIGYTPPISSVPSYNPAWIANLRPYSAVHRSTDTGLNFTLDQINSNSYDGSKLAEVVTLLPLGNSSGIPALVSYDGAIAIPQHSDYPSRIDGVTKLNEILCSLLLGGIHVEVLRAEDLVIGALKDKNSIFAYTPSIHTNLRLKWAAPADRFTPLMNPRVLIVDEMHKAFEQGQNVIKSVNSFSPIFLLSGYTAMVYRNNSDALNNLWITVEQLTEHIWNEQYLKKKRNSFPDSVVKAHLRAERQKKLSHIYTKHKLLCLSGIFSNDCYNVLNHVRQKRNDLVHAGAVPDSSLIEQLWNVMPELIEITSNSEALGLRQLSGGAVESWDIPVRTDFSEWVHLAGTL